MTTFRHKINVLPSGDQNGYNRLMVFLPPGGVAYVF
jgi:hypothetical protein